MIYPGCAVESIGHLTLPTRAVPVARAISVKGNPKDTPTEK